MEIYGIANEMTISLFKLPKIYFSGISTPIERIEKYGNVFFMKHPWQKIFKLTVIFHRQRSTFARESWMIDRI